MHGSRGSRELLLHFPDPIRDFFPCEDLVVSSIPPSVRTLSLSFCREAAQKIHCVQATPAHGQGVVTVARRRHSSALPKPASRISPVLIDSPPEVLLLGDKVEASLLHLDKPLDLLIQHRNIVADLDLLLRLLGGLRGESDAVGAGLLLSHPRLEGFNGSWSCAAFLVLLLLFLVEFCYVPGNTSSKSKLHIVHHGNLLVGAVIRIDGGCQFLNEIILLLSSQLQFGRPWLLSVLGHRFPRSENLLPFEHPLPVMAGLNSSVFFPLELPLMLPFLPHTFAYPTASSTLLARDLLTLPTLCTSTCQHSSPRETFAVNILDVWQQASHNWSVTAGLGKRVLLHLEGPESQIARKRADRGLSCNIVVAYVELLKLAKEFQPFDRLHLVVREIHSAKVHATVKTGNAAKVVMACIQRFECLGKIIVSRRGQPLQKVVGYVEMEQGGEGGERRGVEGHELVVGEIERNERIEGGNGEGRREDNGGKAEAGEGQMLLVFVNVV
mmetsp:Transcript_3788/g.7634  ORF Transcript_3788/g.7634 Transcript_3788/m.7634 type:complete len:497 (-) Transcript_3788:2046-3536(-)